MAAILPLVLPAAVEILKRFIPDQEKQAAAEIELRKVLNEADKARYESEARKAEADAAKVESASSVIRAEAQGESTAGRNWRPHLMYFFMGLIAYGAVLNPLLRTILSLLGVDLPLYQLPAQVWDIMWVCVGGYVIGRSGEKIAGSFFDAKATTAQANAQAEVAKFNNQKYFDILRKKVFMNGMTQEQVDALNEAINEARKG